MKKDIVIVNEFTVNGSRGNTPGKYVLRYMAREDANEVLAPIKRNEEGYVLHYMARKTATEKLSRKDLLKAEEKVKRFDGLGGRAFGTSSSADVPDVSLSDKKLRSFSKILQDAYEKGKTVFKTVISFSTDYLKKHGIIPKDLNVRNRGDMAGHVDQAKIRLAIMDGMDNLSKRFDNLMYVGVVQVDTKHLHAHISAVDLGEGRLTKDGEQKGKLTQKDMMILRRGIDNSLEKMSNVKHMSSSYMHDRKNVKTFVKDFTYKLMNENGGLQFLLATLPENKNLWRAGSNSKEMKKANAITREYVNELFKLKNSNYPDAVKEITEYADGRRRREGLSSKEYRKLVDRGLENLEDRAVNAVYETLKIVEDEDKTVRTPLMDVMSYDPIEIRSISNSDPIVEFGYRLSTYSGRLTHHREQKSKFKEARLNIEEVVQGTDMTEGAKALYDFYKFEEEYNEALMDKYRYFLKFLQLDNDYEEEFEEYKKKRDYYINLQRLRKDPSLKKMNPENAEEEGIKLYNVKGGRFLKDSPDILRIREEKAKEEYDNSKVDFESYLKDCGYVLEEDKISLYEPKNFDEVKALDLHHLSYDFPQDILVSTYNVDNFINVAKQRKQAFDKAEEYLILSEQKEYIEELPKRDIEVMYQFAMRLEGNNVLKSVRSSAELTPKSKTFTLDKSYKEIIQRNVNMAIEFDER